MMFKHFFRPTTPVVLSALLITGTAAAAMYYTLLCALNGAGNCFQLPFVLQLIIIVMLWPWVAAVRFIGVEYIAFASVTGFVLSFVWMYVIACVVRWVVGKMKKKKGAEAPLKA